MKKSAKVDLDLYPDVSLVHPESVTLRVKTHKRMGKLMVEYSDEEDELFVDGMKVVGLFPEDVLSKRVAGVRGSFFLVEAMGGNPINSTLADFLLSNQGFIPRRFQGRTWYFFGTEFLGSGIYDQSHWTKYVRGIGHNGIGPSGVVWEPRLFCLNDFCNYNPAASLKSV